MHRIRPARREEVARIQEIEDDAGLRYGDAGLPEDLEGLPDAVIEAAIDDGTTWVLVDEDDAPIGFALCWARPEALHLRELDVVRAAMGRGHGRALLEHVAAEARARGLAHVTLTTFRDVTWNAPYYARRGFTIVEPRDQPAWLAAIRREEDEGELAAWPRVAMRRATADRPA